jgi:hypothetical protein
MNYELMLDNIVCSKCLNPFEKPFWHSDHTLRSNKNKAYLKCRCIKCDILIMVGYIVPEYKVFSIVKADKSYSEFVIENNKYCDEKIKESTDELSINLFKALKL